MRVRTLVLSLLLVATLAPAASASIPYGVCTEGNAPCESGMLACAYKGTHDLACAPDPCATANCFNADAAAPTVQCSEGLLTNGVLAECQVGSLVVGGPVTCGACVLSRVSLVCTEGTEGVACASNALP